MKITKNEPSLNIYLSKWSGANLRAIAGCLEWSKIHFIEVRMKIKWKEPTIVRIYLSKRPEIWNVDFQYSQQNLNLFPEKNKRLVNNWFRGFFDRLKDLKIKWPDAARTMAMNIPVIKKWFEDYETLARSFDAIGIPGHLWICGETGLRDHFVRKKTVGSAGESCYQLTETEFLSYIIPVYYVRPTLKRVSQFIKLPVPLYQILR